MFQLFSNKGVLFCIYAYYQIIIKPYLAQVSSAERRKQRLPVRVSAGGSQVEWFSTVYLRTALWINWL